MDRREFLKSGASLGGLALASPLVETSQALLGASPSVSTARVAFVKTTDRTAGVNHAINLLGLQTFRGKDIFIKPNFQ